MPKMGQNVLYPAVAVPYRGRGMYMVHFDSFLSVPLKEHLCTPSDKNEHVHAGTEMYLLQRYTKVPTEVQLEPQAILYLH